MYFFVYWQDFYRTQTKLRERNVFTPFCQSFCSQGGGGLPDRDRHWIEIHLDRDSPVQRLPWTGTPCTVKNGRYASYWNAFLSYIGSQCRWQSCLGIFVGSNEILLLHEINITRCQDHDNSGSMWKWYNSDLEYFCVTCCEAAACYIGN